MSALQLPRLSPWFLTFTDTSHQLPKVHLESLSLRATESTGISGCDSDQMAAPLCVSPLPRACPAAHPPCGSPSLLSIRIPQEAVLAISPLGPLQALSSRWMVSYAYFTSCTCSFPRSCLPFHGSLGALLSTPPKCPRYFFRLWILTALPIRSLTHSFTHFEVR